MIADDGAVRRRQRLRGPGVVERQVARVEGSRGVVRSKNGTPIGVFAGGPRALSRRRHRLHVREALHEQIADLGPAVDTAAGAVAGELARFLLGGAS